MDNYYKTLGVKNFTSIDDIKTGYRKLSKKFHPDVNEGDKFFEDLFKEIKTAYDILSDVSKRNSYDENLKRHFQILSRIYTPTNAQAKKPSPSPWFHKGPYMRRGRRL